MTVGPRYTLKLATSLDGKIATATGESKWITSVEARQAGHGLRSRHDAILVGANTVLADDPSLTTRIEDQPGVPHPLRVVLDTRLRTPLSARVISGPEPGCLIVCGPDAPETRRDRLIEAGADVIEVEPGQHGFGVSLFALDTVLKERGIGSTLIEGGSAAATSYLVSGLVSRIEWFRAPFLIGDDGLAAIGGLGLASLADRTIWQRYALAPCGPDMHERYRTGQD